LSGPGRLLALLYAVFALAAGARAAVQIASHLDRAPLAYLLSALAAALYLVVALTIRSTAGALRRVALATLAVELAGVLAVGTLTATGAVDLADETVWSDFGSGYGWLPLVLPLLGLTWLARRARGGDSP
jgi:hypothetical protein